MKEKLGSILAVIAIIVFFPVIFAGAVIHMIVSVPVYYFKYRRSPYFVDFGIKYSFFTVGSLNCRVYNAVKEHGLPIQYIRAEKEGKLDCLVYKDTVILLGVDYILEYSEEKGCFIGENSHPHDRSVHTLDTIKEGYLSSIPDGIYREGMNCVIMAEKKTFPKKDLERAKSSAEFIVYERTRDIPKLLEDYVRVR